jgi:hypothetical protein
MSWGDIPGDLISFKGKIRGGTRGLRGAVSGNHFLGEAG